MTQSTWSRCCPAGGWWGVGVDRVEGDITAQAPRLWWGAKKKKKIKELIDRLRPTAA